MDNSQIPDPQPQASIVPQVPTTTESVAQTVSAPGPTPTIITGGEGGGKKNILFIVIGFILLIAIISGGAYYYMNFMAAKPSTENSSLDLNKQQKASDLEDELESVNLDDLDSEFSSIDSDLNSI